ncbi:hypothetical protein Cni_G21503 [Canna indica]|uniref:Late embryogenesis abundant protein LEA-2 subgroup domain-containing protein n=1 Tax=Canna indica TaxID=4628 RepID=A0AAQ3QKR1_9LILI|nr:hypothetical protein Cni_G21503 [Canna indica]
MEKTLEPFLEPGSRTPICICLISNTIMNYSLEKKKVAIDFGISIITAISLSITCFLLRHDNPSFYIQNGEIYQFNLSSCTTVPADCFLSSIMSVDVFSLNPNVRPGVYYDRLDAHSAYSGQPIILPVSRIDSYSRRGSEMFFKCTINLVLFLNVNVWSPYLLGGSVPVAPYLCDSLQQDKTAGMLLLYVKVDAKIRWKVGTWTSRHYHLEVTCPAYFAFRNTSVDGAPELQFQRMSPCSASV